MGLVGLGIILFFLLMAFFAPFLIPWPQPVRVNLAPPLSAPMWLLGINPAGFTEVAPITNSHFDSDASDWNYGESLEYIEYLAIYSNFSIPVNDTGWGYDSGGYTTPMGSGFDETVGFDPLEGGSGPGSYLFSYIDTTGSGSHGWENISYTFEFDDNLDLGGSFDVHPFRVYLQYAYQMEFYCTEAEMGDAEINMYWILNTSTASHTFSHREWLLPSNRSFRESFQYNMPQSTMNTMFPDATTENMSLTIYMEYYNPSGPNTPQMNLHVDDVKLGIGASYTDAETVAVISSGYSSSEGSDLDTGSGPGCYHFSFNDEAINIAYPNATAYVGFGFSWDVLDRPQAAYLNYQYKVDFTGPIGDANVRIAQEIWVENTDEIITILLGSQITASRVWTASPHNVINAFQLVDTFAVGGNLEARWRVVVYDPTPEDTPTIDIYFDDLDLEVRGNYFGNLGAGQYGEDLWAQLLWGSRIALLVGLLSAAIATFVGLIVGLISGYFGGLVDEVLMRVTDFFLVIPGLPLMIVLAAILSPGWYNIVLVIALIGWTGTARLVRSQVLAERQRAYVEAARAIGASDLYIIFRHVLPNVTPLLFAQITLGVAGSILSEAGLAFLGLTHPHDVSWGRMLMQASQAGAYAEGAWWYVLFPGICIVLLALSFTLVGYAVDEILNPRLRVRSE